MKKIKLSLLRGICQTPAYTAHAKGYFAEEGLDVEIRITPTAWMVPEEILSGAAHFGVIPWTRVAGAAREEAPLKVICGSGHEEAALVVRAGLSPAQVKTVALPREGGMKDLTAMGLIESIGWGKARQLRFPSGDGAIIAFLGQGADAASMVEPYAAMFEALGMGTVVRRTGDVWPGAPGCSLSASAAFLEKEPEVAQKFVNAFVRGAAAVVEDPASAALAASNYIGLKPAFIQKALEANRPNIDAVRNQKSMDTILGLMLKLGYVPEIPKGYVDLRFLDRAASAVGA